MLKQIKEYFQISGDQVSPLPKVTLSITFILLFFNGMVMTMVFAYLPKMVKSFGTSEVNTGYYAGFIASALFIGRTLFCLVWGYIADVKGCKRAAIACSMCMSISTLAFGFSYNFCWAFVTRFLQGSSMGMIVIGKTMVRNKCDDTNIALAMTIILSAFSFGLMVGPSLAGFLVFPAEQYPNLFRKDNIFARFGVLLPNIIIVIGLWIATIVMIFYLPIDSRILASEESYLLQPESQKRRYMEADDEQTNSETYINLSIKDNGYVNQRKNKQDQICYFQIIEPQIGLTTSTPLREKSLITRIKDFKILQVLRKKWCVLSCVLYGVFSVSAIGSEEMFPLYTSTSRTYGGIGFSPLKIGIALLAMSVFLIFVQIFFFSKITRKFGATKVLLWSIFLSAFTTPLLPSIGRIENTAGLWIALSGYLLISRATIAGTFLAVNILINNSVEPGLLGCANGLGSSISSLGRTLGPSIFGSIYSWSLTNVKGVEGNEKALGFPFNQYFAFFMLSLVTFLSAVIACRLPDSLNNQNIEAYNDEDGIGEIPETSCITTVTTSHFKPESNSQF